LALWEKARQTDLIGRYARPCCGRTLKPQVQRSLRRLIASGDLFLFSLGAPKMEDAERMSNRKLQRELKRYYLDRRADQIIFVTEKISDDQLLETKQLAFLLGVSGQWLELLRKKGEGPKWTTLSPRCIRYKMLHVREWLNERSRVGRGKSPPQLSIRVMAYSACGSWPSLSRC
jgi:predicted DNA-binding transcriptional regulator AlpA